MPGRRREEDDRIRESLINLVREHPAIWDTSTSEHKNSTVVANDWAAIMRELTTMFGEDILKQGNAATVEELKKIWQNLRTTNRNVKKDRKGKSGAAAADVELNPKWRFFQQMSFLDLKPSLPTTSSLNLNTEAVNQVGKKECRQ